MLDTHIYTVIDKLVILSVIISIFLFILWPIGAVIKRSFFLSDRFTFELYQNLLVNNWELIYNSLSVSALSALLTVFFALSIALFVFYAKSKIKKVVFALLFLTMISPPFVSSLAYITLFGRRGLITHGLLGLSINPYGWHGIVLMQTLSSVSIATIIIFGVLSSINQNVINASMDAGANSFETIKRVVIPMAKPGIIAAAFISFVQSLSDFGTPIIIGGGFKVLATEAYLQVIGRANLGMASAINVLILIPALLFFIVYRKSIKNIFFVTDTLSLGEGIEEEREFSIKGWIKYILLSITVTYFLFMIIQYISIFLSAISYYSGGQLVFTFDYIRSISADKIGSFMRSIRYAFIAGIFASFIGIILSYYIDRRKIFCGRFLDFAATLPNIVPGTLFGIGYILAFNDYPLAITGTAAIVVINCIFRQLPVSTKTSSAVLQNISPDLEMAAKDLGAHNIFMIKDIILPLMKPAFLVSFINTFVATMTTVGAVIFIISPSTKVATVELFTAIRDGDYGQGAVIASMVIIATLAVNLLFTKLILRPKKYLSEVKNVFPSDRDFKKTERFILPK